MLPFIGAVGAPAALFTTERQQVAPTFYACGTSFTKHLVERIGLPETIALMPHIVPNTVLPRIEAVAKTSMEAIRAEWRKAIGVALTSALSGVARYAHSPIRWTTTVRVCGEVRCSHR